MCRVRLLLSLRMQVEKSLLETHVPFLSEYSLILCLLLRKVKEDEFDVAFRNASLGDLRFNRCLTDPSPSHCVIRWNAES